MSCEGKKIIVDGQEYVLATNHQPQPQGDLVLIRTFSAGVHVGRLKARNGREVDLVDARRVWRWKGANTLHELSQHGCDEEYTRVSEPVPTITLLEAIEILPVSIKAQPSLTKSRWGS